MDIVIYIVLIIIFLMLLAMLLIGVINFFDDSVNHTYEYDEAFEEDIESLECLHESNTQKQSTSCTNALLIGIFLLIVFGEDGE